MRSRINEGDKEAAYQYNEAHDMITEVQSRLTFVLESAPIYTDATSFSKDGLEGMGYMMSDAVEILSKARKILKSLAITEEVRA